MRRRSTPAAISFGAGPPSDGSATSAAAPSAAVANTTSRASTAASSMAAGRAASTSHRLGRVGVERLTQEQHLGCGPNRRPGSSAASPHGWILASPRHAEAAVSTAPQVARGRQLRPTPSAADAGDQDGQSRTARAAVCTRVMKARASSGVPILAISFTSAPPTRRARPRPGPRPAARPVRTAGPWPAAPIRGVFSTVSLARCRG
jgi:hypothetical protein